MADQQNWRTDTTAPEYFLHQKKQAAIENRKPVVRRASDLVGPGISMNAVRITDFNDVLATFNGFFSAAAATTNAPPAGGPYVGFVASDAELGGVQIMTNLNTGNTYRRSFKRNPADADTLYWSTWAII